MSSFIVNLLGIIFLCLLITGILPSCATIRSNVDKTAVVRPPPDMTQKIRDWAKDKENFQCPEGSTWANVVAEVNLATNEARAVIRCKK